MRSTWPHSAKWRATTSSMSSVTCILPTGSLISIVRASMPFEGKEPIHTIERPILPHETSDPAHVVPVIAMLVPPEAIHVRIEGIKHTG